MMEIGVAGELLPIRESLAREVEVAWGRLASPGTWWTGSERLAIAAEARHAKNCPLCQQRKAALSPYTAAGEHDSTSDLPPAAIEAIHRIVTDAGRITERWILSLIEGGEMPVLEETGYVEIIGVIAVLTGLDKLYQALGLPPRDLPGPLPASPAGNDRRVPNGTWPMSPPWRPRMSARKIQTPIPSMATRTSIAESAWCRKRSSIFSTWMWSCI